MAYIIAGTLCIIIGLCSKALKTLVSLGLVLVALAMLNGYVEKWSELKSFNFVGTEILLLAVFLSGYISLSISLVRRKLEVGSSQMVWASASHVLFAWFIGLACLSLILKSDENPAFTVLVFLALVCVLHVPTFAAFKNRFIKAAGPVPSQQSVVRDNPQNLLWAALSLLVGLFVVASAFQFSGTGDWRLIVPNAAICAAQWGLFLVSR
jgi:hypothetical protein